MEDTTTTTGTTTTTIAPVWGVTKTGISGGIITDWDEDGEAQKEYVKNEKGATIFTKVYDEKKTITCTLVSNGTAAPPKVGDKATIDDVEYTVLGVRLIQNNQSVQKHALTLEAWKVPKAS